MNTDEQRAGDVINATISGSVGGQVAIGSGIHQVNVTGGLALK